jgi:ABC-type transporter Mla subunit MlaD
MALQDLTPQLRTRLSRMERAVGWFVFLATALLLFGFGYYIYQKAQQKGWFLVKAKYRTYLSSSTGLKVGDSVLMMGFDVGQITLIHPMPPRDAHNVEVSFNVREPYYRYIWSEGSVVKVNAGFLNQSQLEITRGTGHGYGISSIHPVYFLKLEEARQRVASTTNHWQLWQNVFDENSNLLFRAYTMLNQSNLDRMAALNLESIYAYDNTDKKSDIVSVWNAEGQNYTAYDSKKDQPVELPASEAPGLADQLQGIVAQVQSALPNVLALTNQLAVVLDNAAIATSNLNVAISAAQPMLTNFAIISGELREPGGAVAWALGTNGNDQIQGALTNLNLLLAHTDTNLNTLVIGVGQTLDNVADITSNLNAQVQSNSNMLWGISKMVTDSDDFVQGLKRHWLLRSAFKAENKTNSPAKKK